MLAGVLCGWGMSDFAAAACANSAASALASVVGLVQNFQSGESAAGWVPPWLATVDVGLAAGSVPLVGVVCAVLRLLNGFSCKKLPNLSAAQELVVAVAVKGIHQQEKHPAGGRVSGVCRTHVLSLTASRFCFIHLAPPQNKQTKRRFKFQKERQ